MSTAPRWLKPVIAATVLVFLGAATYLYAFRFFDWVDSDVASIVLLAAEVVEHKFPVVDDYYYCNGDVWTLASHLFSVVPVAIFGVGPLSMWLGVVLGFVIEIALFVKCHLRLAGDRWTAVFAAVVTIMAWSKIHTAYYFINLMYGCYTLLWLSIFTLVGSQLESETTRKRIVFLLAAIVACVAIHNPVRAFAFMLVPVIVGCGWWWTGVARRRRLEVIAPVAVAWLSGYLIYKLVLPKVIAFSVPRGHIQFAFENLSGIATNLERLGAGLVKLCGGTEVPALAIPGALLLAGAFVLVIREVFASRQLTVLRFVGLAILAQTGIVVVPVVFGNLMVDPGSIRYLLPSTSTVLGLAAIVAVRTVQTGSGWSRTLATGWLVAVPITAALVIIDAKPPAPERYVWPDAAEIEKLAKEINRRGLTHGFADIQAANLITVDAERAALVCPIWYRDNIMPIRWLVEADCFRASKIPDTFFVVAHQADQNRNAVRSSLPPPIETFNVGPTYEVSVFPKSASNLRWLDLPLPDNDKTIFPLRIRGDHLQLRRGTSRVEGTKTVSTGQAGTVIYGPYITLPRGRYKVSWRGSIAPSSGAIEFVVAANGNDVLAQGAFTADKAPASPAALVELTFKLPAPRGPIEFLVRTQDGVHVTLDEVVIERR